MIQKIIVEIPISWTKNPIDGFKHKNFISNLIFALTDRKIPLYFRDVPFGADEAPRLPEKGTMVFSYHSWGSEKNVYRMKESPVVPLFSIDSHGYSGWADIVVNPLKYEDNIKSISDYDAESIISHWRDFFIETKSSKYPQSEDILPDDIEDYVFYPMQVQNDPVAIHSNYDGIQLLIDAAELAKRNETFLVVKRHPFCESFAVQQAIENLIKTNHWVVKSNSNIHELIKKSKSVITINSGVGIEALIDGASVYCAGKCEWQIACHPLNGKDDLLNAFSSSSSGMNINQKKHLAFLLNTYWINPEKPENFDLFLNKAFEEFDPEYGVSVQTVSPADVLMPIILDFQGRLEFERRRSVQALIDVKAAIDSNFTLKKENQQILSQFSDYVERVRLYENELEQLRKKVSVSE
ncbi:hypothetical protein [Pantoea sp. SO10]|uniref:capsular polysaccharide export protein, LipB/KpsS family n=1 Tax=Pantoea sp. SO10 TaxID=2575375 RepID=UPI0010C9A47B|nr:hypothetical protein [Pantoea sp. SO10]QCP60137.1 hypothetical protein FCN45_12430 [Pantoea sp. SO10]